jgi:hypothetical protein
MQERSGLGAAVPDDLDAIMPSRALTSDHKLLETLMGKKAAKAHLASKQSSKAITKPSQPVRPQKNVKEESEDEEEGRAASFHSKRTKVAKSQPKDEDMSPAEDSLLNENALSEKTKEDAEAQDDSESEAKRKKQTPKQQRQRAKPVSYLDQILAERSKKKKKSKSG